MFGNMMLFFVALIWGVATVAHSASMAWIGPFTYTATRYALGSVFLFGVWLFVRKSWEKHIARGWRVGMCGGVIMFVACALTQHGI